MSFTLKLNARLEALSKRSKTSVQPLSNKKPKVVGPTVSPATAEEIATDDAVFVKQQEEIKNETHAYEVILHWPRHIWADHSVEYQRVGFKAKATMVDAFAKAEYLADVFRRCAPKSKERLFSKNNPPVIVVAVYRRDAFKDWSKEHGNMYRDPNEFIKIKLAELKEKPKYINGKDKAKTLITANKDRGPNTSTR